METTRSKKDITLNTMTTSEYKYEKWICRNNIKQR